MSSFHSANTSSLVVMILISLWRSIITPYSLNWEFVNSQNKVSDVFDLNMSRVCGGKEWIVQKAKKSKSIKMIVLANGRLE